MMDFNAFDDDLLNPSLLEDIDLWLSSPPAVIAAQPTNEPQSTDSPDDDSGDDDGLYGNVSPSSFGDDRSEGSLGDDRSEGSFGDEEQVIVAADQYSWKIDHSKGDHKFKGALLYSRLYAYASANSN